MSPSFLNEPAKFVLRISLIAVQSCHEGEWVPVRPTGSKTTGVVVNPGRTAVAFVFASSAMTPPNRADQAGRLVWLMGTRPRVALSLKAVVKRSMIAQSFVG